MIIEEHKHLLFEYSKTIGIKAIVLHVEKINERAHQLYRKLGYSDNEDQGSRIQMVKEFNLLIAR